MNFEVMISFCDEKLIQITTFLEAMRVARFHEVATKNGSVADLGKLMRESHRSLDELYECSHENLNRLIDISDRFGVNARLTGAG